MAQLNAEMASKVEAAQDNSGLIDDGIYLAVLTEDVTVKDGTKAPYWTWIFQITPEDAEGQTQAFAGRKLFHRTSLSDSSFFKLKETFEGFGVSPATDTEELVGKKVRLHIIQKMGQRGTDREGQLQVEVKGVLPADGPTGVDEAAKAKREAQAKEQAATVQLEKPLF